MLVLSRKLNETILIGNEIEITVLSIEGDRVRLGLNAPKDMRIFRQELIKEVRDVNQDAISVPSVGMSLSKAVRQAQDNN